MRIKIDAVEGITYPKQLQIISDYICQNQCGGEPIPTKLQTGVKIESCGRRYHVGCHRTKTTIAFKIWWAV